MNTQKYPNLALPLTCTFVVVALLSLIVPAKTAQAATKFVLVRTIISPTPPGAASSVLRWQWRATGLSSDQKN
jgi:hypothetical protein